MRSDGASGSLDRQMDNLREASLPIDALYKRQ
jgi:hypothetical protein